jgi:hypothetical protein
MFIETRDTPNPNSLMFYPGVAVRTCGSAGDSLACGESGCCGRRC